MSTLTEATRDDFFDVVADGVVLVDVWGPSCARCLALFPHVEELAASRPDLRVVKLEAPKARRICIDLKLMGLPAFLLFQNGEEIGRIADPNLTAERLDAWLDETLSTSPQERGGESC
ncbi:MAG: thioredoxin family protein [Actinomycetota bacterium]|nr:thioredoxin family protein [Actinomycetota bacterium]